MESAKVVVVGSGAFGASVAYHLAAMGCQDVAVLEGRGLASQTSPRAAGLTRVANADRPELGRLQLRSIAKIKKFQAETGEQLDWVQSGSVSIARDDATSALMHREIDVGTQLGVRVEEIGAQELHTLVPYAEPINVQAAWYTEEDIYLEPGPLPHGYLAAAGRMGVELLENTAVIGIELDRGAVCAVKTSAGRIGCETVVNAAGAWAPNVARMVGVHLPIVPMRHQILLTESIPSVDAANSACRVRDAKVYLRPSGGGLLFGGYEPDPLHVLSWPSSGGDMAELPLDRAVLDLLIASVADVFPSITAAPVREHRGGLPTMTPDGYPIVGDSGVPGFELITGCNVGGLSISPALGELLAAAIIDGRQRSELAGFSLGRFPTDIPQPDLLRAARETYGSAR